MGSSLAPVLANIIMGFYESRWLNGHNLNKCKFYLKYVDEIPQSVTKYLRQTLLFAWRVCYFLEVFARINKIFVLAGGLGTSLSFYEAYTLS